jgi:hypothetical protein
MGNSCRTLRMQGTEQKGMRASSLVVGSASSGKGVEGGKRKEARIPEVYIVSSALLQKYSFFKAETHDSLSHGFEKIRLAQHDDDTSIFFGGCSARLPWVKIKAEGEIYIRAPSDFGI